MGKYVRGLDYMELEGGRGSGGGGGSRSSSALETIGKVGGPAALVAAGGAGGSEMIKSAREKREAGAREAAAEMKRESRGVEKTFNDRAREAQAESTLQNKTNKAAEDASKNMAKGGTASARADGIAQRGKTRGVMVACGGGMMKK
jgi:hypothetical protein